jgi:NAD-dependent DNA ligase
MDIDGLGEKIIDQLLEKSLVSTYADLFQLKVEQLSDLTHETTIGKKRATEIVKAIQESRVKWLKLRDEPENVRRSALALESHLRWLAAPTRLDWKRMGEKTIAQLVASDIVKSVDDVFELSADRIAALQQHVKVGNATARKIIANAENAKSRGLARVLASLAIRLIGATAARLFAEWAGSIDNLFAATFEQLVDVLAKDPDKKKKSADKERKVAESLHRSLHKSQQRDLFNAGAVQLSLASGATTEALLTARDEQLLRKERLGKSRVRKISECFPAAIELGGASLEELSQCLLEGTEVARSLYEYIHSSQGAKTIENLRAAGVKLEEKAVVRENSEWSGKTVVMTGSFEGFAREKIKERLISLGAKVSESVSSSTDVVLVGANPGSKHDKALKLGVEIRGGDTVSRLMQR